MKSEQSPRKKGKSKSHIFDFKSGLTLVTFLNRIPNLDKIHFKLSEEEENVVGENHNLVVIGRSGTGKTTCALMRLFAIQVFFKNTLVKTMFSQSYRLKSSDLERTTDLKNIFLTASPFLITEIKNKYNELKLHVKVELEAREVEKQLLGQTNTNIQNKGGVTKVQAKYGLDRIETVEKDLRDRESKFTSFSTLEPTDYPGFFSIQEFIIMIDGCLLQSFFVRKEDRSLMMEDVGLRKKRQYSTFKVRIGNMEYMARQCNWDVFSNQFWSTISWKQILRRLNYKRQAYKDVTPIVVWTQIVSIITGSCQAHRFKGFHLPFQVYLKQSKNIFYGILQKRTIFQIFLHYKEWKKKSCHFDFMDICNHILGQFYRIEDYEHCEQSIREVFRSFQEKPIFNYLFLDEVQDLQPAVIYLISKLFENGVYFSGDTAQAIQKGVSFKFSDITNMYRENFPIPRLTHENPTHYNLTANFRSHTQILDLANNIVKVIKSIFPSTIDSMKNQTAKATGPRPILLNREFTNFKNEELIRQLIIPHNVQIFNGNQAFIVRNEVDKEKMNQILKDMKGLVLSVEQCKGLEFEDVVVMNFFDPALTPKWKILKYIDLYPQRGSTNFNLLELNIPDYEELITELKMFYTIVTRARCTLILYDPHIPQQFLHIWQAYSLVENNIYDPANVGKFKKAIEKYKREVLQDTGDSWQKKGFTFYMNKKYELALQCYSRIQGMQDVCKKIKAIISQEKAQQKLYSMQERFNILPYFYQVEEDELPFHNRWKQFIASCEKQIFPELKQAARLFQQINLYQNAADCFYECGECQNALKTYLKCKEKNYKQIGLCFQKLLKYREAADSFFSCQDFTRMMFCLQKFNNYEVCYEYVQKCNGYKYQEYFFRRFSILIVNREYAKIDKQVSQDEIVLSTQPLTNFYKEMEEFSTCQNLFLNAKGCLSIAINDKLAKFKKPYLLEKGILQEVVKLFREKDDIEACREAISKHKFQAQIALSLLNQKIEETRKEFNQRFKDHQEQTVSKEQSEIRARIASLQYKYNQLQQFLLCLHAHQIEQEEKLKQTTIRLLSKQQKYNIGEIKKIITELCSIQLFRSQESKFYFSVLFCRPNQTNLVKTAYDQTSLILEQMQSKLYSIAEQLEQYSTTPIEKLNLLKIKKKKLSHYQYFDSIAGEDQYILTRKRYLPAMPFVDQIIEVIEELSLLLKRYHQHAYNQRKEEYELDYCNKIYDEITKRLKSQNIVFPLKNPFGLHYQLEAEKLKLNEIVEKFFQNKVISTTQRKNQYTKLEERRKLAQPEKGSFHHRQLSKIAVEASLESGKISKEQLTILEKLELIAPRAYLSVAFNLGLKQLVVESFIWCLSYKSVNYVNKANYFSDAKLKPKDPGTLINLLNPLFFDFKISRTKYRLENAADQILEAAILLGFCEEICSKLSLKRQIELKFVFLKEDSINKQMKKLRQNLNIPLQDNTSLKSLMGQEIYLKMKEIEVMNLYKYFDQFHENAWMNPVKKIYVHLEEDQICQINKDCIEAKQNIKQQLHSMENQKKKQICEGMELLGSYEGLISKIKQDEQRKERKLANEYLISNLKGQANICELPFEESLQEAIKHMVKLTDRNKNKKYTSLSYQIDKAYFSVEDIKKQYSNLLKTLERKVKHVIENRQLDQIFKDIDSLYQIEVDSKILHDILFDILDYLWKEYIIRSEKKAQEFQELFNQIFRQKQRYHQEVKRYQIFERTIVDYLNKIENNLKSSKQFLQKYKELLTSIEEKKTKLAFYEHDFINTETRRILQEKEKQAYLEQRYKKAIEVKIDEKKLHCSYRTIFFWKDAQSTASFFFKIAKQLEKATSEEIANVVIIYLSYQNYPTFKKNFDPEVLKKISLTCQGLKTRFRNCFDSPQNLSLLTCLLQMFKCRLVSDQPNMSIFKYFILVNKESPLLKIFKEKPKTFGYFMDQKRETILMKVSNILQELERQTKVGLPWSADQSFEAVPWLSANYDKMMPDKKSQLIQKVQHLRVRLFEFMGDNQFISHQSSLFVYHQLKCYRDLLCLILEGEMNLSLQKMIVRDMQELENEWQSWIPYATKFQFVFKRM